MLVMQRSAKYGGMLGAKGERLDKLRCEELF